MNNPLLSPKYLRRLVALVVLLLFIWLGLTLYKVFTFHIVSTNPSVGNVATISPFFEVNFNRSLSKTGLQVSYSPALVSSYTVQGKAIRFSLRGPLANNHAYYITVVSVQDTAGKKLANKRLSFVPRTVAFQDLPKDQRAVILQKQAIHAPSKSNISFSGTDALINDGLTSSQLNDLEQNFFNFDKQAKNIVISNVEPGPLDPNSTSTAFTVTFQAVVDGAHYNGTAICSDLNTARLQLSNAQTGVAVFDSANNSD